MMLSGFVVAAWAPGSPAPGQGLQPEREVRRLDRDRRIRAAGPVPGRPRRAAARDLASCQRLWHQGRPPGLRRHGAEPDPDAAIRRLRRKGLWEIHYDPYDVSRIWVRDHWNGGWISVFWTQLHRVAAPFGELAWDHTRKSLPGATEAELANAVEDLLTRAGQGPGGGDGPGTGLTKRDRRVAARTRAVQPAIAEDLAPEQEEPADEPGKDATEPDQVVPMPIFDPFREAAKWR